MFYTNFNFFGVLSALIAAQTPTSNCYHGIGSMRGTNRRYGNRSANRDWNSKPRNIDHDLEIAGWNKAVEIEKTQRRAGRSGFISLVKKAHKHDSKTYGSWKAARKAAKKAWHAQQSGA